MPPPTFQVQTARLSLRGWTDDDRSAFAEMNADEEVMRDLGGPLSRAESDRKLDRYAEAFDRFGYGRWLIELASEGGTPECLGYAGVMPVRSEHPLGHHEEIGWRLRRSAWGYGYATEAARAALDDVFRRIGLAEVLSYTARDNTRSQAVMARLNLRRVESLDFVATYDGGEAWHGLVWAAANPHRT